MPLEKQVIPLKILGYNGKVESKVAPPGVLANAENVQSIRRTGDGTVELRKRNGFTEVAGGKAIAGGEDLITACSTGAAYGNELVLLDGHDLFSRSETSQNWARKGHAQRIAADLNIVGGNESTNGSTSGGSAASPINVDSAYMTGYSCHVSSGDYDGINTPMRINVRDDVTKAVIATYTAEFEFRAKVVACGGFFFVFAWKEPSTGTGTKITVRKISASAGTLTGPTDVTTAIDPTGDNGLYDIQSDTAHGKIWITFKTAGGGITIMSWIASTNVAGVSAVYATHEIDQTVGFIEWDYSTAKGYVAIAEDVGGVTFDVAVLEFSTVDAVVSSYTLIASVSQGSSPNDVNITNVTGYRTAAGVLNVFYNLFDQSTSSPQIVKESIQGYSGGSSFDVMLSVFLASRVFKVGTRWYMQVARDFYRNPIGNRLLLLELEENTHRANDGEISICAMLQNSDAFGVPESPAFLTSAAVIGGTRVLTAAAAVLNRASVESHAVTEHYAHVAIDLDFTGAGLGKPVEYNGVLHLPAAAHREYDGKDVVESGFYVDPEAPFEFDTPAGGGFFAEDLTYQYCCTWARIDSRGRLHRSAPGPISEVTIPTGGATSIKFYLYNYRATDTWHTFTVNNPNVGQVRIEYWRTIGDGDVFYLAGWAENEPGNQYTGVVTDTMIDDLIESNEILYTVSEELDNQKVPAVKVLHSFQQRLFALTGDGSIWHSKESAEGFGAEFSDEFRILSDDTPDRPTTLGSLDTIFYVFKRNRAFVTQGQGPDDKGAGNPFPRLQPLEQDIGCINATGAIDVPNGIMVETAKGRFMLNRSVSFEAVEGTEDRSSLTIVGGVGLDSRSMTVFVTNGALLVRDWQLSQWYAWSGSLAGVAICRSRNSLHIFQSDGTVLKEIPGQFFDGTSTPIAETVEFDFTRLENLRLYQLRLVGAIMGSTTLTETVTYNGNESTAASKTKAVTTADVDDLNIIPNTGRAASVKFKLTESSTTEGFRLSMVGLEVGQKLGLKKVGTGRNFT